MAIAVPVLAVAVPASATGGNYWISNDVNHGDWTGAGIYSDVGNQPYYAAQGHGIAFFLVDCQFIVSSGPWCLMEDSNGHCMNEVDSWNGNPTEHAVVDSSCVQNDTAEEWMAFSGVGHDVNVLENLHTGLYMNIETQSCPITPCDTGIIHLANYAWTWNTPGA